MEFIDLTGEFFIIFPDVSFEKDSIVGDYRILSRLGAGGMGEVYLAEDLRLQRKLALKVLPPSFTEDKDRLRRFQQEARAASSLNHPNIITIYQIGDEGDSHFIATEFIDGVTLRQFAAGARPLALNELLALMLQVCAALEAAHEAGIIHRDIKPENVMVRPDGYVKVLDFGLAKLTPRLPIAPSGEAHQQTDPGVVLGTVSYMSPEQARGLTVTEQTDVWSLGVVLYELLAGRRPFGGETTTDLLVSILTEEPAPPSQLNPSLPTELDEVVKKALAKDSSRRYPNIKEMRGEINRLLQRLSMQSVLERSTRQQIATVIEHGLSEQIKEYAAAPNTDDIPTHQLSVQGAATDPSKFLADVIPPDLSDELELETAHVLFTDIVGYSTLPMGQQVQVLKQLQEVITQTEQFRRARERDQLIRLPTGDGMALVFFRNSAAPIQCAFEVARALQNYPHVRLRMGVHSGYVCAVEDINGKVNVAGDGINYAQRVMDQGDAGHILVSKAVADALRQFGKWSEWLHDLGMVEVKHGVLVHIFNLYTDEIGNPARPSKIPEKPASTISKASQVQHSINSIAVLPLINISKDEGAEYLSDGITESIISNLSQLPKLKVMARSTVFRYKGKEVDPRQVGEDLRVGSVLTGRIQQLGGSLIIRTELVNVSDGTQLWGGQFNRKPADILELQEEISQEISEKLRLKLTGKQKKKLSKKHTQDTDAYKLYLKGRYCLGKMTNDDLQQAIKYFKKAINTDPGYALAYAGMADAYYGLSSVYMPSKEAMPLARAAAEKALELDESLAEGHVSLGLVKVYYDWDWKGAEAQYQQAIRLNPGYAWAHQCYGWYLTLTNRTAQAAEHLRKANELDPLSPEASSDLAMPFFFERQYDKAIECWQRTLEIEEDFIWALFYMGWAYEAKGDVRKAIEIFEKTRESYDAPLIAAGLGHAYAVSGERDKALLILEKLEAQNRQRHVAPYHLAIINTGLGETERAVEELYKTYEARSEALLWLKADPRLDPLRSNERFRELVERVGL